jgi:hypothetical protein
VTDAYQVTSAHTSGRWRGHRARACPRRSFPGAKAVTAALSAVSRSRSSARPSTNAGNSTIGWVGPVANQQYPAANSTVPPASTRPGPPGRHADQRGGHVLPHAQQDRQLRGGRLAVPGREQVRGPQDQKRGGVVAPRSGPVLSPGHAAPMSGTAAAARRQTSCPTSDRKLAAPIPPTAWPSHPASLPSVPA